MALQCVVRVHGVPILLMGQGRGRVCAMGQLMGRGRVCAKSQDMKMCCLLWVRWRAWEVTLHNPKRPHQPQGG
jgi:hypothetical protein